MWIKNKFGHAVNSQHLISIRCDDEKSPFRVYAWCPDYAGECDNAFYLNEFDTRAEAKQYIADFVRFLNTGELTNTAIQELM